MPTLRSRSSAAPLVAAAAADAARAERYVIPNLRNACRILKQLGRHPDGMKVADLARELKIPVTTTLRIMATLHLEGMVRKQDGRYEPGPVLIQLGTAALSATEVRELALPLLHKLTTLTDETSHLAVPCDDRSLIVAVNDSPHPLRAASRPGFLAELHCSSTGKVFLAHLHPNGIAGVLTREPPTRHTPNTLMTLKELKREVEVTLDRGYSLDNEEFNRGVRCLAVPVFNAAGTVVAAIGITASIVRFTDDRIPEMAGKVQSVANELSHLLGYAGGV